MSPQQSEKPREGESLRKETTTILTDIINAASTTSNFKFDNRLTAERLEAGYGEAGPNRLPAPDQELPDFDPSTLDESKQRQQVRKIDAFWYGQRRQTVLTWIRWTLSVAALLAISEFVWKFISKKDRDRTHESGQP